MTDVMEVILAIIYAALYPGGLFAFFMGAMFLWSYRKLRARMQSRVGPPWYQVFADIVKLFNKETIIPKVAHRTLFVLAPIIALTGCVTALWLLPIPAHVLPTAEPLVSPLAFWADIIVILYLLALIEVGEIVAGASSASPYGAVGASRRVNLLLSSELPFAVSIVGVVIFMKTLSVNEMMVKQAKEGPFLITSVEGLDPMLYVLSVVFRICLFISFLLCVLAKMGKRPFDIPEAECEILAGPLTEYSGKLLGLFEVTNALKWFVLPAFTVILFIGGDTSIITFLIKCFVIVLILAYIDIINPRYRIDQAYKFFMKVALLLSLVGLIGEMLVLYAVVGV
ncbi:MAG: respiratory chain complex I subunit 1 family protein [Candidatus Baldrarchaeia archaeon]